MRPAGLRRLLDESLVLPRLLDPRSVERLVAWVRQLEFHELRYADLDTAVRAIHAITLGDGPPRDDSYPTPTGGA